MKLAPHFLLLFFLFVSQFVFAQELPFWSDIQEFKKQDSVHPPQKNSILFVGSSSFTNWKDVQSYFPDYPIINRGFGGSTLLDVMMYASDVILPYQPKQIVIYCGENDLANVDTVSAKTVAGRFMGLFDIIRHVWDEVPVIYISIKPSPSRARLMPKMIEANGFINAFLKTKKNTVFVDVYHKMLTTDGKLMPEIYIEDSLHMNAKGYAIWQKTIEPYLLK